MPRGKARIWLVIRKSFGDMYDRLGLVVMSSLVVSVVLLGITAAAQVFLKATKHPAAVAVWLVGLILVGSPLVAGLFVMARKIVYREDPSILDMLAGFREMLPESWGLGVINAVVAIVLLGDAAFFLGFYKPLQGSPVGFGLGMLALYVLLMWMVAGVYQYPVLVDQRCGALAAVKKSVLLALGSPGFTIILFVVTLGFGVLCALSGIGMLVVLAGTVAILLTHALRELYLRYELIEPEDQ